ncbi:MAG: bifunctional precorrin-2 dehydrogenase/sirohydrochlorin ferrochelatase [Methanobrevibacter woesei]|uniref:precorrin-2 dehydrogenase/sirohydrochlorin ferrochelatase family protein n=1 Tax=Methanobrevibacter woesei TaxID=190976 RepID=UPI0023F4E4B0|nr:bifunctional precorrin-2 dehydrogenase/sirohydrochlorin ferrochelatase [Methanobrevibacter woesei]MCI7291629.1 bifunctional precorrin-2 dehydrogenase/sirohydrochlorin ferrochelatase [Methanobrevibacter woesei]
MNWTSVYLKTNSLNVFILGTGEVATRRADKFLSHGASVKLAGDSLDSFIKEKGAILVSTDDVDELVNWADLVIIASGDRELSNYVASIADKKLLNRADFPNEGNLIVPTSFNIGDVEISIFTNGKSPLMARQLRKRIQEIITDEDLIKMELQDYARSILKEKVENQKERRTYLYTIFEDKNIHNLIEKNKIDEAKSYIYNLINEN